MSGEIHEIFFLQSAVFREFHKITSIFFFDMQRICRNLSHVQKNPATL